MPAKKKTTQKKSTASKAKTKKKNTTKKTSPKKKVTKKKTAEPKKQKIVTPETLRGMKDLLPKDAPYWKELFHAAETIAESYGYERIQTPILEETSLFIRSIGKGTDVVDKEMYSFEDRDGSKICLRPEATASTVRAYINHGMQTYPQPVKLWYWGTMYRHDRPQAGRYREFRQFGCEVFGERDAVIDAELISVAYNYLRDLGINTTIHINSIGTAEDREKYIIELVGYLRSKRSYLSDESKKRITKNPLRVLDSKDEQDQPIIEEAPQIIDWLSDDSRKFFMDVLEYLDELEIPYVLTPTLVRGLDYYTDIVFEIYPEDEEKKSQSALGGGGRYDGLVTQLGGQETAASGFALGVDRILPLVRKKRMKEEEDGDAATVSGPRIFFAQLGEQARRRGLALVEQLRRDGITVKHNLARPSLKAQLEIANKFGASHTVILGQKEVQDGTIIVRDMDSGIQEIIDQKKLKNELQKILK